MKMSKSLKRVQQTLADHNINARLLEMAEDTRTAAQAATAAGCEIDQIGKSILFQGQNSGSVFLFITPGGRQVDVTKAAMVAKEPLIRADSKTVRATTGFAIGGVAPFAHVQQIPVFMDRFLQEYDQIWVAAGTPRHVVAISPADLENYFGCQIAVFT